jgi:hypothetical protein
LHAVDNDRFWCLNFVAKQGVGRWYLWPRILFGRIFRLSAIDYLTRTLDLSGDISPCSPSINFFESVDLPFQFIQTSFVMCMGSFGD